MTSVPEIARRLINGVWTTGVAEDSTGGNSEPDLYSLRKTICVFTETAGAGTYTAEVPVIAGGRVIDVPAFVIAGPWTNTETAVLGGGDTAEPAGYFDSANPDCDLVGSLNVPYDPTAEGLSTGGVRSGWIDPAILLNLDDGPTPAYGPTVGLYAASYNGLASGVPYPDADTITLTVTTTGVALGPIVSATVGSMGGSGYAPGDTGNVNADIIDAVYVVDTVDGGGAVLTFHISDPGTDYSVADDVETFVIDGGGDGLFAVNITAIAPTAPSGVLHVDVIGFGVTPETIHAVKS